MKTHRPLILAIIGLAVLLFGIFTGITFKAELTRPRLPVLGQVRPFTLIDAEGQGFHSDQLANKVWVANFFFTTCANICPIMSRNMASLSRSFDQIRDIRFVSVSVNPEQDSPEALKSYAQKLRKGKDNWFFLTGTRQEITDVAVNNFKLGDIHEPIFHSSYFALVDKGGMIRGYYDGTNLTDINRLFKDIAVLLKEKRFLGA